MADEPTLPLLPSRTGVRKKRSRHSDSPPPPHSSSSDPAFFSSDDDPAIDNYQSNGRRKRRYVGTWYDQHPASSDSALGEEMQPSYPPPRRTRPPKPQKREFRRQLDSGVWMGAEGSVTDTDDSFDLEPAAARLPLAPPPRAVVTAMPPPPIWPRLSPQEQKVQDAINFCIENGTEQVDLSGMDLKTIPEHQIRALSNIAPIPNVTRDVAFEQKEPEIQLFLSNNLLRRFPVALANVEHITVLSLRANRLVTIPPAIGKLVNLSTLNVAQNFLNFLPGELLTLLRPGGKMRNFAYEPNRFWQPQAVTDAAAVAANARHATQYERLTFPSQQPETKLESSWSGATTKVYARTPVQFLDSALNTCTSFALPPTIYNPPRSRERSQAQQQEGVPVSPLEVEPFTTLATPTKPIYRDMHHLPIDTSPRGKYPRGPRSLFELAVRTCAAASIAATGDDSDDDRAAEHPNHHRRRTDLVPSWMPRHFAPAVQRAVDIRRQGGATCAVCGRDTAMPMALWVEFRHIRHMSIVVEENAGRGREEEETGEGEREGDWYVDEMNTTWLNTGNNNNNNPVGSGGEGGGMMMLVPFLRVACSWVCVPVKVKGIEAEREEGR
ncbi:hypothetical protein VTI28DRAFT_1199 [Corynascus sepedonium]